MKISKEDLKQIIKEELENVLSEKETPFDIDLANAALGFIAAYVDDPSLPLKVKVVRQLKYENAERQLIRAKKQKSFAGVNDPRAKFAISNMSDARANKSQDFEDAKARGAKTQVSGTGMN